MSRPGRDSQRRTALRPWCIALIAATLVSGGVLGGCETLSRDLEDLTRGLTAPSPSEAALMAIDPDDPDRRREGTLLLANAPFGGNPPYLRLYRDIVENDDDPLVRAAGIRALARHGEVEDATLIAAQLDDENLQVRWEAAKGLQRLHAPIVVPALLGVLRDADESAEVRVAATLALGQYPEERVLQGLIAALNERELAVNVSAESSLETLTGQSLGLDAWAWLTWAQANADDPFAGRQEYLYPTYRRKESWWEKMAFWSGRTFEQPAPPAGLRPASERRTYEDEDETATHDDSAGG